MMCETDADEDGSRSILRGGSHGVEGDPDSGSGAHATGHDPSTVHTYFLRVISDRFIDDCTFKGTRDQAKQQLHELLAFHRDFAGNRIHSYRLEEREPVDWWAMWKR